MAKIIRIGGSFAIVLVAYWAYALVAVPLIEPSAERHGSGRLSEEELANWAQAEKEQWRKELEGLFPPDAWELQDPKILEIDQVKLLFRDYTRLEDGSRVEISPCTMIFVPHAPAADRSERKRRSIILEAPEGALMKFDRPFDLRQAKVGRIEGGALKGRITIRSQGKSPGPEDDLLVVTRQVELSEKQISTPHAVDFRLGANYGRGRQMRIKLLPGEKDDRRERRGPNVAGIESFEVGKLERLHLHFGQNGFVPGVQTEAGRRAGPAKSPAKSDLESDLPIEVTCRGPFRFDVTQQVATFEDHVDVLQVHPEGPSDQLNCETLSVYFARPRKDVPQPAKGKPSQPESKANPPEGLKLRARRIVASGMPVVVRAPSQQVDARGETLEYDVDSGRIVLNGTQAVYLKHGPNEIHGRNLRYQSGEAGRLGQVVAEGPGWLRGQTPDKPGQTLQARWNELLRLHPHDDEHVISLTGGAELTFGGVGRIAAKEIYFWLFEGPQAGPDKRSQVRPDRMLAQGEVRLRSPQLTGSVDELGIWFQQAPAHAAPAGQARRAPSCRAGILPAYAKGPVDSRAGPVAQSPAPSLVPVAGQEHAAHHFEIVGHLLQARVLVRGDKSELTELTVEKDVQLTETRCAVPDDSPVAIRGDSIHVVDAGTPRRAVTVTGSPAHFQGRGLGLTGSNINLNCGTNRLWIDGPGWMDLPLDCDLDGRPLRDPGRVRVRWQQRMTFDGRTACFEESVLATSRQSHRTMDLHTETLDVGFLNPIRFADVTSQPEPQIERIVCHGRVIVQSGSFEKQIQSSLDCLEVSDMQINLLNGDCTACGPGRMTTVRRGGPDPVTAPAGQSPSDPRSTPTNSDQNRLTDSDRNRLRYLDVSFQGPLAGNLHNRELAFNDRVKTIYGPVDSWQATLDPDGPDGLGRHGVLLSCDQMTVADVPLPVGDGRAAELTAQGNVVIEGQTFTARAPRMTYAEAKQLLILEGNGRTHAELYHQEHVGAPFSKVLAHKILYWRSTGQVYVEGARSLKSN